MQQAFNALSIRAGIVLWTPSPGKRPLDTHHPPQTLAWRAEEGPIMASRPGKETSDDECWMAPLPERSVSRHTWNTPRGGTV